MKISRLFILIAMLYSVGSLSAQDKDKPSLLTITAGWSYADYKIGDDSKTDARNGLFLGLRKDVKIVPMLHFNTGLLYTQQGASIEYSEGENSTLKSSYLDVPIGLKFKLGPIFATGGVSANIKLGDNFDDVYKGIPDAPELKAFDLVYSLGIGAKLAMLSIDLRWNNSFGDIIKDNDGESIMNSYFLVGLGFSIHRK